MDGDGHEARAPDRDFLRRLDERYRARQRSTASSLGRTAKRGAVMRCFVAEVYMRREVNGARPTERGMVIARMSSRGTAMAIGSRGILPCVEVVWRPQPRRRSKAASPMLRIDTGAATQCCSLLKRDPRERDHMLMQPRVTLIRLGPSRR